MYQYVVAHTFYEQNILDGHLLEQFVMEGEQAVERLFGLGLVNLRACEQRAVRARIDRLA